MRKLIPILSLGVTALLASSVGTAATVVVTPSTLTPLVGEVFTVTLQAVDFVNVGGGTISMTWDTSRALFASVNNGACAACLPATGPVGIGTGSFVQVHLPSFDILPGAPPLNGSFDIAVFQFNSIAPGALNLQVFENAANFDGWFDNDTADPIPTSYVQAQAGACYLDGSPCPPVPDIPAPPAVWLLGTALAGLGGRQWMRRKAN